MKRLILLAAFATAALMAQTPAGDAAHGKAIFTKDGCYECHGYAGQGGAAGARISNIGLNAQGLIRYVRAPAGAMPAYTAKVVSDQDLTDIWAYLQSLPKAKPPKEIPLLDAIEK